MADKSNFLDYESLKHERSPQSPSDDQFSFPRARLDEQSDRADFGGSDEQSLTKPKAKVRLEPDWDPKNKRKQSIPSSPEADDFESQTPSLSQPLTYGQLILKKGHSLSFLGVFVFTFFVYFRPYEWSPNLLWLSRGALITAIVTLLLFMPTQLGLENTITIKPREVKLVLALLVLAFLSIVMAVDRTLAWKGFLEFLKVVVIFIVMVNVLRSEARLKALILIVLVASCVLSGMVIKEYQNPDLAVGYRISGKLGGILENPNDLALHLVTLFPIVLVLAFAARNVFLKLFYVLAALILLAGTVVTFSRSGFVGLVFVVATLIWKLFEKRRVLVICGTLVMAVVFLGLAGSSYRQRMATTDDDSAYARTGELKRSIHVALRNPVLGVGMDNYVVFSDTDHASHNAYTQVASEIGIPAAVIYILFLLTVLKRTKPIPHPQIVEPSQRSLAYLAIGVQSALVGYIVASFFASVAYLWYVYYLAAYAICIWRLWEITQSTSSSTTAIQTDRI